MRRPVLGRALLGVVALTVVSSLPGEAQEDFRHVDEGRPTRIEDAYPLKAREWEWQLGSGLDLVENGPTVGAAALEVKLGLARNLQVGVEAHGLLERESPTTASGLEEVVVHGLYNLNQEGRRMPALAVRLDGLLPGAGELGRNRAGGRVKAMATRTLGSIRIHGNLARRFGEAADRSWEGGVGFDRPIGFTSRAVVGDVFLEAPEGGDVRVWIDAGMRMQISRQAVLDWGIAVRADQWGDGLSNVGFLVGISRAFGFARQARVPAYRVPLLR